MIVEPTFVYGGLKQLVVSVIHDFVTIVNSRSEVAGSLVIKNCVIGMFQVAFLWGSM